MSILPATTFNDAIINLRALVINVTGLPNNLVLNGDSLYGATALRMIQDTIGTAPAVQNTFIIFEFKENEDSQEFAAGPISNLETESIVPYSFFLKIYGDDCHQLSQKLLTNFKFPQTVIDLRSKGIYIINTSAVKSLNEFINNVRWPRCDLQIDVICRFQFQLNQNLDRPEIAAYTQPISITNF